MLTAGLTIPPATTLNSVATGAAARQLALAGAQQIVPVIFGTDFRAGLILNVLPQAVGSDRLLVQVVWGHGPIGGVDQLLLNDQAFPSGTVFRHYNGTQAVLDTGLGSAMASQGITYTVVYAGYAYSVIDMPIRAFTGELRITARVQGLLLYDPRLDSTAGGSGAHRLATPSTWTYSDNPALALARWLWDPTFGCGLTVSWASVITTANSNDVLIGVPGERRRVIGLSIDRPVRVFDQAEALRAYAGCWIVPTPAGVRLVPDASEASSASYSHAAGNIAAISPLTSRDTGSSPTVVEIIYTDSSKRPVRDATASASRAGAGTTIPYRLSQVRLPGVHRFGQATREAIERLNKLWLGDLTLTLEVLDEGIAHEVGDVIDVTHPIGLTNKPFRIAEPPTLVARGRWRLVLVEYDGAMYSNAVATAPTVPDTLLVNPAGPPPNVAGLSAVVIAGAVRLTWSASNVADYDATELRRGATWATGVRLDTGAAGSLDIAGTGYDWLWPGPGSYTVLARHRDTSGSLSATAASVVVNVTAAGIGLDPVTLVADNVLSRVEKPVLIPQVAAIEQERLGIYAQANAWGLGSQRVTYETAVNALLGYLIGLSPAWNDVSQDTPIDGALLRSRFSDVYSTRQVVLDQIAGASLIATASGTNLIWNSKGNTGTAGWLPTATSAFSALPGFPFWPSAYASGGAFGQSCRDGFFGDWITVQPGDQFFVSWDSIPYGGGAMNWVSGLNLFAQDTSSTGGFTVFSASRAAALTGARSISGVYTVPGSGVARIRPYVQIDKPGANLSALDGDAIFFTNVILRRLNNTADLAPEAATTVIDIAASSTVNVSGSFYTSGPPYTGNQPFSAVLSTAYVAPVDLVLMIKAETAFEYLFGSVNPFGNTANVEWAIAVNGAWSAFTEQFFWNGRLGDGVGSSQSGTAVAMRRIVMTAGQTVTVEFMMRKLYATSTLTANRPVMRLEAIKR